MSMTGEYLRVTPFELRRAIKDPVWALQYAQDVLEREDASEPSLEDARHFSTYKSWDLLRYLLTRADFPVDVIGGDEWIQTDEDWGIGPPRYLSAERVGVAAAALGQTTYDDLIRGVDPDELSQADLYSWDPRHAVEDARDYYDLLGTFFSASARSGDAMVMWTV